MALNLDGSFASYRENYLDDKISQVLYTNISKIFQTEEKLRVETDNVSYKLNRKTLVFVDNTVDLTIIPKIWGKNISILPFQDEMQSLRERLEKDLNFKFNICLANYYENGKSGIAYHSDNEELGSTSCIASLSFGSERKFLFRKKETLEQILSLSLKNGSLLVMGDGCQENYHHSVPIDKSVKEPRLNLTFRLFDSERYRVF